MRNDEFAVIQHVVTNETIDESGNLLLEFGGLSLELRKRFSEAVRDVYFSSSQFPH